MKSFRLATLVTALALAGFVLTGCGKKHDEGDGHDHGAEKAESKAEGHEGEAPTGASFKPGKGVILTDETRQSLGVETAEVTERKLPVELRFTVQVFGEDHKPTAAETSHAECTCKASGLLGQTQAGMLQTNQPASLASKSGEALGGIVLDVKPAKALALGDAEVVIGVTNVGAQFKPGDFLSATVATPRDEAVAVVPKSAVLRSAEGSFVYTLNGDAYFRTAIKTGSEAEGFVEVTDGLLSGDVVVTKPVEKIWLIELRATRGGGHSH